MKRISIFLSVILLLTLCGCGEQPEPISGAELVSPAPSEVPAVEIDENAYGYLIPSSWTENSVNDESWGYVTQEAEPGLNATRQGDILVAQSYDEEARLPVILRYDLDGNETARILMEIDTKYESVQDPCFLGDELWLIHNYYTPVDPDQEAGEMDTRTVLECRDLSGALLEQRDLAEFPEAGEEMFISSMSPTPEGHLLILCFNERTYEVDPAGDIRIWDLGMDWVNAVWDAGAADRSAEELALSRIEREELIDAIVSLGDPDATILIAKYFIGLKGAEIAAMLHMKENTVVSRASRAQIGRAHV